MASSSPFDASHQTGSKFTPRAPLASCGFVDVRQVSDRAPVDRTRLDRANIGIVVMQPNGNEGLRVSLKREPIYIGRNNADIRFANDPYISPRHAVIVPDEHGATIIDLDSLNGVYIRVAQEARIEPGDMILVGRQLLRYSPALLNKSIELDRDGVQTFGSSIGTNWGKIVRIAPGGSTADSYILAQESITIGRDEGEIRFPDDPYISRRHANLRQIGNSCLLADLGSANGTYRRIRMRCPVNLQVGSWIRLGNAILQIRVL